jgi:acyl transferase domain-containing protein
MPFDPLVYGMPPNSLNSIEPIHLFLLETVRRALADAGYADRAFDRERTAVILGAGGGAAQLAMAYGFRSYLPMLDTVPGAGAPAAELLKKCEGLLPEWTEDSFPGILLNVAAGRVANRFNFGGPNFSIDAACGSSLAALYAAVKELEMGTSDTVVLMGADTVQNPFTYMLFSKTHAFSPRGRCSTFDESADGIVISEGVAVVVLKRLADAERDGDRIYAVIKGVGASSDGKDKGLTAPRPEGQLRALRRAYAKAGISPARVGLIEAHGTGTVVGDQTEVQSLAQIMREAGAAPRGCAVGSVKSMIGHTKCAAGLAGLINATLALHHKTLPPLLVNRPNSKAKFEESPLFLNTEARPWIHGHPDHPRTAGVSAFGFGGTNYHAVLEEYTGNYLSETPPALRTWPAELFVWRKPTRAALIEAVEACHRALEKGAKPEPRDLAYSLWQAAQVSGGRESLEQSKDSGDSRVPLARMAIVAISLEDLQEKLAQALKGLRANQDAIHDPRGVYVSGGHSALRTPHSAMPKVAFLFPGQGSQYPNMLAQLALVFAEVRQAFDNAERTLTGKYDRPLGKFIFPPSTFTPEQEAEARRAITRTDVAQPAIGAASLGMLHLLQRLGLQPDFLAGHSYGDYVALCAAGALSEEDLIRLSYERGRVIVEASGQMPGSMAAIEANLETVAKVIAGIDGVTAANINTPSQTVISGTNEGVQAALERFQKRGIRGQKLPVACGFHSPSVAPAREPFAKALAACRFAPPRRPVYANTTAAPYPPDPAALAALLAEHLTSPVQFLAEVEALYAAGARIFVEVGPQGVLTGLVGQILAGRPHLAVTGDVKGRPGLVQLQHLLAQLLTEGLPLRLDRLYQNRQCKALDLANLDQETGQVKHSPTTWLVNSVRVRPWNAPEPQFLGKPCGEPASRPPGGLAEPSSKPASELIPPVTRTPISSRSPAPISAMSNPTPTPNCNGLPPQPPAPVSGGEAAQVMMRFQDLMARFLDTQRNVMLSYLQGSGGTAAVGPSLPPLSLPTPLPTPAAANGHPPAPPAPASVGTAAPQSEPPPVSAPPPPPKPEPLVAKVERKPEGVDREELTTRLLDIVRQRTGYPLEMLGLDLDLEADLGIDSIKRVEILGSLTESSGADSNGTTPEMEKLTGIKTLRGIIDCLAGAEASRPKHGTARQGTDRAVPESICQVPEMSAGAGRDRGGIQRMLVVAEDVSLPSATPLLPVGTILVTDDGKGVARALAARLREMGQTVALLRMVAGAELTAQGATFQADLTEPRAVEALLHRVRQQMGPVAGLVHLLPLAEPAARETWNQRVNREVKSLFLLARGLADELCRCASEGRALLLAATSMGQPASRECEPSDDHGDSGASRPPLGVASGGVGGIVKSLAHEWPEVLVRVIDVDVTSPAAELAERLLAELGDPEGPVEVAYHGPRRTAWQCVPAPVDLSVPPALSLEADSTILLTGGARGITAAVALELARRYRPNLVLVGRSPLPQAEESPDTMGLTAAADLKAALIGRLRREGSTVTPAAVEAAYHRLLQDREIRGNLARLRETGAQVHYYSADVRDELAFAAVIDEVYRRFGRIDGVIHGAGVIQDKLIRDKTPESFDRVFGTKVDSALILSRHLRPESLRFCLFFASVAGRFGNRGQSDYAAANEVLTKLAAALDRRWPGRVASVVWGPWSSIGMVAELEAHLGQRGLQMIPPEVGPLFLVEELTHGRKGEVEVVIAGDVGQLARRSGTRSARAGKQEPIGAKQ